jgi:hypothetical protein
VKRLALLFLVALAAGAAAYALITWRHAGTGTRFARTSGSDLEWIRAEFSLDEKQYAAVVELHNTYWVVCGRHCADIVDAREQVARLRTAGAPAADLDAAEKTLAALEDVCNNATRAHLQRVAAHMPPEQGRRYLAMIEPHLESRPHDPGARDGLRR